MSDRLVLEELGPAWDHWVALCPNADVYHLSGYIAAMNGGAGSLPKLVVFQSDLGVVVHPLVFRLLDEFGPRFSGMYDATTCYGYGGPAWVLGGATSHHSLLQAFWHSEAEFLRELGVVSEFVRLHPLVPAHEPLQGTAWLVERGTTVAIDLSGDGTALQAGLSNNHRRNIRAARRVGVEISFCQQPESIDAFGELHTLTMDRLGARPEYYLGRACLRALFAISPGSAWLGTAHLGGQLVAGAVYLCGKSFWHYHLGASDDAGRHCGANHLLLFESACLASRLGKSHMHLGGGRGCSHDGLLRFKMGFGGQGHQFRTVQRVLLPDAYTRLCAQAGIRHEETDYFPAYRSPEAVPSPIATLAPAVPMPEVVGRAAGGSRTIDPSLPRL